MHFVVVKESQIPPGLGIYSRSAKKLVHLRKLEGVSFVSRRYTKGEPFLSKMVCKRMRGGVGGREGWRTLFV